jgi:hypothetical protein
MRAPLYRLSLLLSVTLAACGGPLTGLRGDLRYASATNSCAPTDGPAVSITLSSTPVGSGRVDRPYLTLSIWTGLGDLPGKTFSFAAASPDGFGAYFGEDTTKTETVTGTVHIDRIARDSSITATLNIRLADGSRIVRTFIAPWQATRMLCG